MAVIPFYQPRQGLEVGGGVNLPALDQTLARSVENLGGTISAVAEHMQARQKQKDAFSAEQSWLQFQNKTNEEYALAKSQMPVAGDGFHDSWVGTDLKPGLYDKRASEWLATLPADQREDYALRAQTYKTQWSVTATKDQLTERDNWFKSSLQSASDDLTLQIRRNGNADFETFRASGDKLIMNSPFSPAEKEMMLKDWHANAAMSRVMGIAAQDPQKALDELNAWLRPQAVPGGASRAIPQDVSGAIDAAAAQAGIDPALMRAYALIESSGNPRSGAGGKYQGLFQLGADEFAKGGGGDILNAADNARAAAINIKEHVAAFRAKFGRAPAPVELYLMHQQGEAGAFAHLANPSGIAWENVRKFYGSDAVAKQAIWGNVPDDVKKRFPGGVETLTSGDFNQIWAEKIGRFGGGHSSLADLSPAQLDKVQGQVQTAVNQQRAADNRIASEGREEIVKYGEDLIHNAGQPNKPQLTEEWVMANRDNLSPSDYKYFKTALDRDEGEATIKTPPQELLRLDDLVQSDPRRALTELRDEFSNKTITRGTYDQLVGRAQSIINGEEKRPYIAQIRDYLQQQIRPGADGSSTEYQTALRQLFAYDDWAAKNKDATREQAQKYASDVAASYQKYRVTTLRETLPLPRFLGSDSRLSVNPNLLQIAKDRTAAAVSAKTITPAEAAEEANKIKAWEALIANPLYAVTF